MSQAGIVDIEGSHPQIPTLFVANVGSAIPIANTLEILGSVVDAHGTPVQTVASGNTVNIDVQLASAVLSSAAANAGLASFDSADFTVDSNGFVQFSSGVFAEDFQVDASTPPGTNPVEPNGTGTVIITGGQVAAGTTTNVIRTNSLAANTFTIQIQRSQAAASSTVGDNGVSHFNSTYFTVDANGFVSVNGSHIGSTITGDTGGALSPTAGNWTFTGGTTGLTFAGAGSTETLGGTLILANGGTNASLTASNGGIFYSTATAGAILSGTATANQMLQSGASTTPAWSTATWPATTTINDILYSSANNVVGQITASNDGVLISGTTGIPSWLANSVTPGYVLTANSGAPPSWQSVSASGAITTLTGNSGGAISPSAGNINTLGTGSITIVGSGSTLTTELTGLTNHAVLVGAGTPTITSVGPSATTGAVFIGAGSSADPAYSTTFSVTDSTAAAVMTTSSGALTPIIAVQSTSGSQFSTIVATANSTKTGFYASGQGDLSTGNYWCFGMQSINSNAFAISYNAVGRPAPEGGTQGITITTAGVVSFPSAPLGAASGGTGRATLTAHAVLVGEGTSAVGQIGPSATTGAVFIGAGASADPAYSTTFSVNDASTIALLSSSNNGGFNLIECQNTSNTAGSGTSVSSVVGGTSGGNALFQVSNTTDTQWSWGMSAATNSSWRLAASGNIGTTDTVIVNRSGAMTKPLQPAFTAFLSSPASSVTGDGTVFTIIFDSTNFNVGTMYNTSTGVATIPVAGKYLITAQCLITSIGVAHTGCNFDVVSTTGTYGTSAIFHGSDLNPATCRDLAINANDLLLQAQGFINFAANDAFKVQLTVSGSTKTVGVFGAASPNFYTMFSAVLLC